MARFSYKPTPRAVYVCLLMVSAVALKLPRQWSDALKHAVQVLVPAQDCLTAVGYHAAAATAGIEDVQRDLRLERDALLNELASQIALADQLRKENAALRLVREKLLPSSLPILPARVVARDIVEWRDSLLVERGSLRGAAWQDWVASRLFVDQGAVQGAAEGQAVLARECLLGRVEQVSPYMSRVQLLTDVNSPRIQVQIGSQVGEEIVFVDYPCSLRGQGRGRMAIEDVPYRYVQERGETQPAEAGPRIRVGDRVLTAPGQVGLPVPLVVGKVAGLEQDPKKRLVYTLRVEPVVPIEEIRDVFIIPLVPTGPLPIR